MTSDPRRHSQSDIEAGRLMVPFNNDRLDKQMTDAEVDVVIATSRHNIQYLLGGYRPFFLAGLDAFGLSRVVPTLGYPRGRPDQAFYLGNPTEAYQQEVTPLWVPTVRDEVWTTEMVAKLTAEYISGITGTDSATVAVEMPFMPADLLDRLRLTLPSVKFVDGVSMLEEVRAVKTPPELAIIKEAAAAVVEAMLAVIRDAASGISTQELADSLRDEEMSRGLVFDYCLVAAGRSFNRFPSRAPWQDGMVLSLDSGGNKHGYICDMCRMAVMRPPTSEMIELLDEVDSVQMAARRPIRAGALGKEIYEAARAEVSHCSHRAEMWFEAHGMGLISHEAPRLTANATVPYPGTHADRPLEVGMVLSIETTLKNPQVGLVKLEDTVVVTASGFEAYGDVGRRWNIAG